MLESYQSVNNNIYTTMESFLNKIDEKFSIIPKIS